MKCSSYHLVLRDDDPLLVLVIIIFLAFLPAGCGTVLVCVQIPHAVAAVLLDALALSSYFITRLVTMIILNDTDDDDSHLMALSNNDRGFPDLALLPLPLAALVTCLPPRPPLLDDVDELLEEVEEDHSGGGVQPKPHSSVVITRLSASMMIPVLTMLMVRLESVGEEVEESVTSQSANS